MFYNIHALWLFEQKYKMCVKFYIILQLYLEIFSYKHFNH